MKNLLPLLLLLACSCSYDSREKDDPTPVADTTIHYGVTIKPIITMYCTGTGAQRCHVSNSNQGSPGDFTTYTDLKAKVDAGLIKSRVFDDGGGMPPAYSEGPKALTADDLAKFKMWVKQGAPEN
ncbi:MAG TPA: hypothetical protein PK509_03595 [Catalimonadaceae bacterium]|nr:hypothetical protein [Catalimonadaceae bacterium]